MKTKLSLLISIMDHNMVTPYLFLSAIFMVLVTYLRGKSKNKVPFGDSYIPIIGHTHLVLGGSKELMRNIKYVCEDANKKGGVLILRIAFDNSYFITDPEDYLRVANGTMQKHFVYEFARNWLGDGLITSSGDTWKRHRKLINPAFSMQMLNSFTGIFNNEARNLVFNIRNEMEGHVDITRLLRQMAMKTLFLTAFGLDVDDDDFGQKYMHAADALLALYVQRFQKIIYQNQFFYKLSGLKKEEDKIIESILTMSNKVISNKRKMIENATQLNDIENKSKSILDLLLKGLDDDALTDREIREEVDTTIVAGFDTTSWVMTIALVVLGTYPQMQDKVYQEITSVIGDVEADVEKTDYANLVYCEAVLKETLRLYPIVPLVFRHTKCDIELRHSTLPAGTNCILGIYGVNRHPVWGPDADTFRPERWLEPGGVPEDTNTFAAFSVGKRTCIGKTYALMAMKTTMVHLLRRYKVTSDISKVEFKMDVLMTPTENCNVKFELRN